MGVNMALERRFQEPLAVTLAMEWRFQGLLAVKLALERRFQGCLGAWRESKDATGCRKERPKASEWTPRARKSMPSGPWTLKKTNFVTQLSRESVSVCFSIDFWHFCKVGEASEVPRLSAKTRVRLFAWRVKSLSLCNLEKRRKSSPKLMRNRQKSHLGATWSALGAHFEPAKIRFCSRHLAKMKLLPPKGPDLRRTHCMYVYI